MAKLSPDAVAVLMKEGTFHGIKLLLKQNKITEAQASEILSRSYAALLLEVEEAKKEIRHIQNALARLESTCRAGKQAKNVHVGDHSHAQLGDTVVALDNWIVSLMETNMTITGMLNPSLTRRKITEFGIAMNALMDKRMAAQHPVLADPSLFSGYINW